MAARHGSCVAGIFTVTSARAADDLGQTDRRAIPAPRVPALSRPAPAVPGPALQRPGPALCRAGTTHLPFAVAPPLPARVQWSTQLHSPGSSHRLSAAT